jgi:hypothetical protein
MRRSRKPVWAFPSIGGSNPPLSVERQRLPGVVDGLRKVPHLKGRLTATLEDVGAR